MSMDTSRSWTILGNTRLNAGQHKLALEAYRIALEKDERFPLPISNAIGAARTGLLGEELDPFIERLRADWKSSLKGASLMGQALSSIAARRVGNFIPYSRLTFNDPQRLCVGALSRQSPFRLIETGTPYALIARVKSFPQYRLPRSLCMISPGAGRQRNHAMRSASTTRSWRMCGFIDQPTTWRLNRSGITARYRQPSSVAMYVISLVQAALGVAGEKSLANRIGATGNA
jgi:hypothetical protein